MLQKLRGSNSKGFTLIELMIVIAIIGILAAIAIPQFSAYRTRSFNSASQSDLRNAATAQEAYFVDESTYCNSTTILIGATYGLYLSDKVIFTIGSGGDETYRMTTSNTSGDATFIIRGPGGSISKM
mgnify:CR=1 FL=1